VEIGGGQRILGMNRDKGAPALPARIVNAREAFLDEAAAPSAGGERGGELCERLHVRRRRLLPGEPGGDGFDQSRLNVDEPKTPPMLRA
jgi:hypothetical protein